MFPEPPLVARSLVGMVISFGLIQPGIGLSEEFLDDDAVAETLTSLVLDGIGSR